MTDINEIRQGLEGTTANAPWHLGSMNDGIFIINTPPSPAGTDAPPWENPNGPTMVLNIVDLPVGKAQKIVDAHNAAIRLLLSRLEEAERQRDEARAALEAQDERMSDEHIFILVEALSEIKATVDGESDQPVKDIVYGCLAEIEALPVLARALVKERSQ